MSKTVPDSQWMCDKCLLKSFYSYLLKNGDNILPLGLIHVTYTTMTNATFLYKNDSSGGGW